MQNLLNLAYTKNVVPVLHHRPPLNSALKIFSILNDRSILPPLSLLSEGRLVVCEDVVAVTTELTVVVDRSVEVTMKDEECEDRTLYSICAVDDLM